MALVSIFYCEFDNILGPTLRHHVPEDPHEQGSSKGGLEMFPSSHMMSPAATRGMPHARAREIFDSISDYIITPDELCGRLITLNVSNRDTAASSEHSEESDLYPRSRSRRSRRSRSTSLGSQVDLTDDDGSDMSFNDGHVSKHYNYKIFGVPHSVAGSKYGRNRFSFNVCFLLPGDCGAAQSAPYKHVLRKLTGILRTLEVESEFLSKPEKGSANLKSLLGKVLRDLNTKAECIARIDSANMLALKLIPVFRKPQRTILECEVPVRTVNDIEAYVTPKWDMTLQQILPHINGINFVKRIAMESRVSVGLVKQCLQQLIYYGCITMVDIFQYTNQYRTTSRITELVESEPLQLECINFITKRGKTPPTFAAVYRLYCSLRPGLRMGKFCQKSKTAALNIDERRFITFGLIAGFLQRVYEYPVYKNIGSLRNKSAPKSAPGVLHMQRLNPKSVSISQLKINQSLNKSSIMQMHKRGAASLKRNGKGAADNYSNFPSAGNQDGALNASRETDDSRDETSNTITNTTQNLNEESSNTSSLANASMKNNLATMRKKAQSKILELCDGLNSYDMICCKLMRSYQEVDREVRSNPNCVVIMRA